MSVIETIKDRLDLAEVIGRTVQLQRAGRNLRGLCPFHSEKTPSFYVFPDSQRWQCFGCNRGGDIFTFTMETQGLDFRAALEELGRQAGVEVRPLTPTQVQAGAEADRLLALSRAAATYFHTLLLSAPQAARAREYLQRRGFKASTLETFQLGYSLRSWDALRTHLLGQGFSVEDMVKAGLLVEKEEGGTYDRFRDRLMIPIRDRRGHVIAFGGRVLNPEDEPKYMNSPQSPLFDKSQVLFGFDLASQAIREADAAIIVEGYMDVMIPYQEGYHNVVAPMGTALTEAHLKQLHRLTRHFIMALDPDAAGINATLRGLETARQSLEREWEPIFDPRGLIGYEGRLNAEIRVVTLPDGLDPDELLLRAPERWAQLLGEAQPIVRFYFAQLLEQENKGEPKGKARIVDAMLPLLRDISNAVEREAYAQEIALQLGLDARMLLDRLRTRERAEAVQREQAHNDHDQPQDQETHALRILLAYPALLERVDMELVKLDLDPICDEDFTAEGRLLWLALLELMDNPALEWEDLLPPELAARIKEWAQTPLPERTPDEWTRDLLRTILWIRERNLRQRNQEVRDLLLEAKAMGDAKGAEYAAAMTRLAETLMRIQRALWPKPLRR